MGETNAGWKGCKLGSETQAGYAWAQLCIHLGHVGHGQQNKLKFKELMFVLYMPTKVLTLTSFLAPEVLARNRKKTSVSGARNNKKKALSIYWPQKSPKRTEEPL